MNNAPEINETNRPSVALSSDGGASDDSELTPRQVRERDFYDEFVGKMEPSEIGFEPIRGDEARPWNPYWYAYGVVRDLYTAGARTLLDVGCGTGLVSVRCARLGYEVTGVDVSTASVAIARHNARLNLLDGKTRFEVGVVERLAFPDESFDVVTGFDVLHHVEVAPAVAECLRVLKPGGVAVFKEWVEAPVLDRLRRLPPMRWFAPVGRSLDREVTDDERKMTAEEVATIVRSCPDVAVRRFRLFGRLNRALFLPEGRSSPLERLDAMLIRALPVLGRLGGAAVFVLRKPGGA